MRIPIVYEDENLIVIDKPSGIIVHPKNKEDKSHSVTEWLVTKYPQVKEVGEDPTRPGIVHRLDKETSGLMLLAKNNEAFFYIKKLFQEHKVKKYYTALVSGIVKKDSDVITLTIGRIGLKRTTEVKKGRLIDPKEAITEYSVLKRFKDSTLVQARPKTGRTHQIRVHFKSLGHPLVCDRVYGGRRMVCPPGLTRLFLHSQKIEFSTMDGRFLTIEADLPSDLQNFINTLE